MLAAFIAISANQPAMSPIIPWYSVLLRFRCIRCNNHRKFQTDSSQLARKLYQLKAVDYAGERYRRCQAGERWGAYPVVLPTLPVLPSMPIHPQNRDFEGAHLTHFNI